MRSSASITVLSLAVLQGVSALNSALVRKLDTLALWGRNPDGSPMKTHYSSSRRASNAPSLDNETIVAEYVELPLDHFGDEGTFRNRFWVREAAYRPGGPVFLYDKGELSAGAIALPVLQQEDSFFKEMVDQFGGIGIVWEHRYYGDSIPGGVVDVNTTAETLKWLTTAQALADVDYFAKQFDRPSINYTLTPNQTPWVFVGGSYPGMRAAFMRDQYPDTIFASFASSAPVQASIDMSFYFEPIVRGLIRYGFGNCTKDMHAAIMYMDKVLEDPSTAADLKTRFLGLGAANNANPTFADALTVTMWRWQGNGVEGGAGGLRAFCDWIETDPSQNQTAPVEGWTESKGANFTVERWATFPAFVGLVNSFLTTNCSGDINIEGDCDLDLPFQDADTIAWTWQYCTEWGFFQSANLGPNQIVSKYNSLQHQHDICHRQFPTASPALLPGWPAVNATNSKFGGWNLRPSQTYWSGGEFDPWRTLSPLSNESGAPHPRTFTEPPECGVGQDEEEIFGYVMPDAQHEYDVRTVVGFSGGEASRGYFNEALRKWLLCWTPRV